MNLFDFQLKEKQLLDLPYLKDIEAEIRIMQENSYRSGTCLFEYRLFALAMKLFRDKSKRQLPDMMYNAYHNAERNITSSLFKLSDHTLYNSITYDEYIEIFKYTDKIRFTHNQGQSVKALANLVLNNPQPYELGLNYHPEAFYKFTADENSTLRRVLYIEEFKKQLNTTDNTVVEDELTYLYNEYTAYEKQEPTYSVATRHRYLNSVMDTIESKICK